MIFSCWNTLTPRYLVSGYMAVLPRHLHDFTTIGYWNTVFSWDLKIRNHVPHNLQLPFSVQNFVMNSLFMNILVWSKFKPLMKQDIPVMDRFARKYIGIMASLALCQENPLVTGGFLSRRPSNVGLWGFLWCQLNSLRPSDAYMRR